MPHSFNVPQDVAAAPRLAAVVVTHNGGRLLAESLRSLVASEACPDILVVDNASGDGSVAALEHEFPDIALLRNRRNRLFAPATNQGLAWALGRGATHVLVQNADVFWEPGALCALLGFARARPRVAACQPLLVRADRPGIIQSAGCRVALTGRACDALAGRPVSAAGASPLSVPGASGAALLLSAAALRQAGGFCDDFGMYFEDVELSLRLRALGFDICCLPGARARHVGGASSAAYPAGRKAAFCEKNALLLATRLYPPLGLAAALTLGPAAAVLAACRHLLAGRPGPAAGLLSGVAKGLCAVPRHLVARFALARAGARPQRFWPLVETTTLFPGPKA
jgi:GT2 family glycosyltransferase